MSTTSTAEKLILSISLTIKAPRERVFNAFASVDELAKWFEPGECHVTSGDLDFRESGEYRLHMLTTTFGKSELTGTFEEIVPNEKIRYTWAWENNEIMAPWGQMNVTIHFRDTNGGTEIEIIHTGLISEEVRDGHNEGWQGSFDKLSTCYGG